jgi:hypothetical protein
MFSTCHPKALKMNLKVTSMRKPSKEALQTTIILNEFWTASENFCTFNFTPEHFTINILTMDNLPNVKIIIRVISLSIKGIVNLFL